MLDGHDAHRCYAGARGKRLMFFRREVDCPRTCHFAGIVTYFRLSKSRSLQFRLLHRNCRILLKHVTIPGLLSNHVTIPNLLSKYVAVSIKLQR